MVADPLLDLLPRTELEGVDVRKLLSSGSTNGAEKSSRGK